MEGRLQAERQELLVIVCDIITGSKGGNENLELGNSSPRIVRTSPCHRKYGGQT